MTEVLFWACAAFVFYAYAGYAIALYVLAAIFGKPIRRDDIEPDVSFIITARNEQVRIAQKIENTLAVDYPANRLEIIVASDCSTDDTHAIVEGYADRGVRLVISPVRGGKESAQKAAIAAARGDILVFSDVATRLAPDGVRAILRPFADPTVGCVSSVDRLIDASGQVSGEGAYVRYEMLLRSLESQLGSVIGLSGSFFAARRKVCDPWAVDLPSDFSTVLNTLRLGLRGISEPAAIGFYSNISDPRREYGRKVRTIVRGMTALAHHMHLLNPLRYGLAAWQLFSHKVCRWLVPYALIGMLIANAFLAFGSPFYAVLGVAQVVAYAVAASGMRDPDRLSKLRRLLTFFVLVNVSILNAWHDAVRGRRVVVWDPSNR